MTIFAPRTCWCLPNTHDWLIIFSMWKEREEVQVRSKSVVLGCDEVSQVYHLERNGIIRPKACKVNQRLSGKYVGSHMVIEVSMRQSDGSTLFLVEHSLWKYIRWEYPFKGHTRFQPNIHFGNIFLKVTQDSNYTLTLGTPPFGNFPLKVT